MKPFRLGVFAVAIALGACTSSPTSHSADPAGPSYDGGNMIGTGNAEEGPGMLGSGNLEEEDDGGNGLGSGNVAGSNTSSDSTTNERGGNGLGSGN